jgi:aspartyl-tRNA(Asn)/glutamyl-tRNA(Gln) amidotransferase subunit A
MLKEDVLFASAREQGSLLRARKIGAVELTESYLERLETLGPRLAAVVTVTRELALAQAHRAQQEILAGRYLGPLHGIPYGAKDLLATKGIPTTWGARPLRNQIFGFDATVIERLRAAGAVLLGKLAMIELAGGLGYNNPDASFTGACRTPWNLDHWSGGSSSGSGSATAAGLVAFALGSETSGSILSPATACGVAGLRPTYGLVSRHGAMALSWTLDKVGPLGRTADDCGLVLAAIAGRDPRDPSTRGEFAYRVRGREDGGPTRRFRVAVPRDATARAEPEVRDNFQRAVEVLRNFAQIDEEVVFPDLPYGAAVEVIVSGDAASAFRGLIESGAVKQLQDRADRRGGFSAMLTPAADYVDAMRLRVRMRAELDALLSRYDAVVAPTYGRTAPSVGYDFDQPKEPAPTFPEEAPRAPALIPAGNLAGLPALGLPTGLGRHGLPTGMQLVGRAFSEATLLALGDRLQEATDWHRVRPPLFGAA